TDTVRATSAPVPDRAPEPVPRAAPGKPALTPEYRSRLASGFTLSRRTDEVRQKGEPTRSFVALLRALLSIDGPIRRSVCAPSVVSSAGPLEGPLRTRRAAAGPAIITPVDRARMRRP